MIKYKHKNMSAERYKELLTKRWRIYQDVFGFDNLERRVNKRFNREGGKKSVSELLSLITIKGKKLLDAGSCCGEFLFEAVQAGAIGYGIEPDDLSLEISKLLFQNNNQEAQLVRGSVEELPFLENSFDLVVSIFILEHVKNTEKTIIEMMRVLKPGGTLWLRCPNYLYPREYHYKRYYLPFFPKVIEQVYFNIVSGRQSDYFMKLKRITPGLIRKILKKNGYQYRDITEGKMNNKRWLSRLLYRFDIFPEINLLIYK